MVFVHEVRITPVHVLGSGQQPLAGINQRWRDCTLAQAHALEAELSHDMFHVFWYLFLGDGLLEAAWYPIIGIRSLVVVLVRLVVIVAVMDPRVVLCHIVCERVPGLSSIRTRHTGLLCA